MDVIDHLSKSTLFSVVDHFQRYLHRFFRVFELFSTFLFKDLIFSGFSEIPLFVYRFAKLPVGAPGSLNSLQVSQMVPLLTHDFDDGGSVILLFAHADPLEFSRNDYLEAHTLYS